MREEVKKRFLCRDCGICTHEINEYYMVLNEVWLESGLKKYDGMLCIGCLEARLGRKLEHKDFISCRINVEYEKMSPRLLDRVTRKH